MPFSIQFKAHCPVICFLFSCGKYSKQICRFVRVSMCCVLRWKYFKWMIGPVFNTLFVLKQNAYLTAVSNNETVRTVIRNWSSKKNIPIAFLLIKKGLLIRKQLKYIHYFHQHKSEEKERKTEIFFLEIRYSLKCTHALFSFEKFILNSLLINLWLQPK